MAVVEASQAALRAPAAGMSEEEQRAEAWTRVDTACAAAWAVLALLLRSLLAVRIEGMLDDDQAVVGLMALDIAAGRRWPIFFDGQRYMGALEAYTAAPFVSLLGHSPAVVALAPTLYCGLFVAAQFVLCRRWAGRRAGHCAALVAAVGSPMLALWGVAPRGGYSEILAWGAIVLCVYRAVTRPGSRLLSRRTQVGWGFLFALGYFLNPLSLIVYTTLALDWLFGRHGADLHTWHWPQGGWIDAPGALLGWLAIGGVAIMLLAFGCHVAIDPVTNQTAFVWTLGLFPPAIGKPLGALMVAAVLAASLWWTGLVLRVWRLLRSHVWAVAGIVAALAPFPVYNLRVLSGFEPRGNSLPMWIRAPWSIGPNVRDGLFALRPLVGCDPHAAEFSVVGPFLNLPATGWPCVEYALLRATPWVIVLVVALIATAAWRDREGWRLFWALRGDRPTPLSVLLLIGVFVSLGLYLLQATSASVASIRYLLPIWIFLPGLLAQGLLAWPRATRFAAVGVLLVAWSGAQAVAWRNMAQPSPMRALADELDRRGVTCIVAPAHLGLIVADLTQGRVGAVAFRPAWPRLGDRYRRRIPPEGPITCVNDLAFGLPPVGALGIHLRALSRRYPGKVKFIEQRGAYEIWQANLPLGEILEAEMERGPGRDASRAPGPCPAHGDRRR